MRKKIKVSRLKNWSGDVHHIIHDSSAKGCKEAWGKWIEK